MTMNQKQAESLRAVQLFCCLAELSRADLAEALAALRRRRRRGDNNRTRDIADLDVALAFFGELLGDLYAVDDDAEMLQELRDLAPTRLPRAQRETRDWPTQRALIWLAAGSDCLARVLRDKASPAVRTAHVAISNLVAFIDGQTFLSSFDARALREHVAVRIGVSYVHEETLGHAAWLEQHTEPRGGVAVAS